MVDWTGNPELTKRINKATGGQTGRLPFFFQYSKNGRSDKTNGKRKRQWAKQNNSTMNRICAAFDDIGNINLNWAGVPPFNWQMLMPGVCNGTRSDIVIEFVALSNLKKSIVINNAEDPLHDDDDVSRQLIIEEHARNTLTRKFGSLTYCYPYVCKYLFTGENAGKTSYKQMFWKIFGDMAVAYLRKNLENYKVCQKCNMKYPEWVERHSCPKDVQGFYQCTDCGTWCVRTNSRQSRCPDCQEHYRHDAKKANKEKTKQRRKERAEQYSIFLRLR